MNKDLTHYFPRQSLAHRILGYKIPGHWLILALIIVEVVFKLDPGIGLILYIIFLLVSSFYLVFIDLNQYLTYLLIIPAIRIAGTAFSGELDMLFASFLMLVMILIRLNFSEHRISLLGFSWKRVKKTGNTAFVLLGISLVFGIAGGIFARTLLSTIQFSYALLITLLVGALVEEFYFRGVLMTLDTKAITFLIIPFLYAVLFFNGNLVGAGIALALNFFLGALFYEYKIIYFPMLTHLTFSIFLLTM